MTTVGLTHIGTLFTGVLTAPAIESESLLVRDGTIAAIGAESRVGAAGADVVVDCRGTTVMPGLIDSHCHVVLGDYTPRQKTVDFLDSYVHGGITGVASTGEGVHAPGRPHDPAASKALAIATAKCFENFHPNGMKVHAGWVVLEPGLTDADFAEMARHDVRHAKYGFGAYRDPCDGLPEVRAAQKHGLCVMSPRATWRSSSSRRAICARRSTSSGWRASEERSTASASRATRRPAPASCPWA